MEMLNTENFRIVQLDPSEWEAYKNLRLRALKEEPQAFAATYEEIVNKPNEYWQLRLEMAQRRKNRWPVFAKDGNKLVGMMGASMNDTDSVYTTTITAVYVPKEERGRGISKSLMPNEGTA